MIIREMFYFNGNLYDKDTFLGRMTDVVYAIIPVKNLMNVSISIQEAYNVFANKVEAESYLNKESK